MINIQRDDHALKLHNTYVGSFAQVLLAGYVTTYTVIFTNW